MRVWFCGDFIDVNIGDRFFCGHCGSGHSVFGEGAVLARITKKHFVFVTDSGAEVHTSNDNLSIVYGKAAKENIFVSVGKRREGSYIHSPISFWDEKKLRLVKK